MLGGCEESEGSGQWFPGRSSVLLDLNAGGVVVPVREEKAKGGYGISLW